MIKVNSAFCIFVLLLTTLSFVPGGIEAQTQQPDSVLRITLKDIVGLAVKNNLELRMARTDSAIAREEVLNARMLRTPYISAGLNYNFIGNPVLYRDFYSNDTTVNYLNHHAGWEILAGIPVYSGGRINNMINQRELEGQIRQEMLKMTEAQIKLEVIQQFYNLYKLYREAEIIEANIKSIELRIRQLVSRVANGQNLISDLKRTELQLSNYQIDVFRTRNNIDIISNYLCILSGIDGPRIIIPDKAVIMIPGDTLLYNECLRQAMEKRYELKQAVLNVNLSELNLDMTRSARRPVITGNAMYTSQYPVPGTFPPQPDILNYWAVGLGVSYEISSLYNINNRIKSDKLQIEKDIIQTEKIKNSIEQELRVAYIRFIESKKNIDAYNKNIDLALSNYKIVKSKYDNEFALIIDMIDAEIQLNDAQLSLNNAIIDAINQYYSLQYSMGNLN